MLSIFNSYLSWLAHGSGGKVLLLKEDVLLGKGEAGKIWE